MCLKNPATAHLAELCEESGELRELHICNSCITRYHLDLSNKPLPISKILDLAAAVTLDAESADSSNDDIADTMSITELENDLPSCSACGLSYADFTKNNRFACAKDYEAFSSELVNLFNELHGSEQHIGRSPSNSDQQSQLLAKRIRLEKKLQDVIAEERFEEAASIRDQIKELDL